MTTPKTLSEKDIVEAAASRLEQFGKVWSRFRIHSTHPHDAPDFDMVFVPRSGPNADAVIAIEFKSAPRVGGYIPSASIASVASLLEHLQERYPNRRVLVIMSTDGAVGASGTRIGERDGFRLLAHVQDGEHLAKGVADIVGAK